MMRKPGPMSALVMILLLSSFNLENKPAPMKEIIPEIPVPMVKLDAIVKVKKINGAIYVAIDENYDNNIDLQATYELIPNPSWIDDDYRLRFIDYQE